MSQLRSIVLVVGAAWICGACAHSLNTLEVTEAVGPAPLLASTGPTGTLRVYTPTEQFYDEQAHYDLHRDFSILTPGGKILQYVRNADHRWDETPALVSLPVGSYKIRSRTLSGEIATIAVVVERGRTTNVHLDGSFAGSEAPSATLPSVAAGPGDLVTLPDGETIGWGAGPSPKP